LALTLPPQKDLPFRLRQRRNPLYHSIPTVYSGQFIKNQPTITEQPVTTTKSITLQEWGIKSPNPEPVFNHLLGAIIKPGSIDPTT
jgi:hypothetical protein